MTTTTTTHRYEIRYMGEVIDSQDWPTDDAARAWRDRLVDGIMRNEFPSYLGRDDFTDRAECRTAHRLIRLNSN